MFAFVLCIFLAILGMKYVVTFPGVARPPCCFIDLAGPAVARAPGVANLEPRGVRGHRQSVRGADVRCGWRSAAQPLVACDLVLQVRARSLCGAERHHGSRDAWPALADDVAPPLSGGMAIQPRLPPGCAGIFAPVKPWRVALVPHLLYRQFYGLGSLPGVELEHSAWEHWQVGHCSHSDGKTSAPFSFGG